MSLPVPVDETPAGSLPKEHELPSRRSSATAHSESPPLAFTREQPGDAHDHAALSSVHVPLLQSSPALDLKHGDCKYSAGVEETSGPGLQLQAPLQGSEQPKCKAMDSQKCNVSREEATEELSLPVSAVLLLVLGLVVSLAAIGYGLFLTIISQPCLLSVQHSYEKQLWDERFGNNTLAAVPLASKIEDDNFTRSIVINVTAECNNLAASMSQISPSQAADNAHKNIIISN